MISRMNIAIDRRTKERIEEAKARGELLNVSEICRTAINRALDDIIKRKMMERILLLDKPEDVV